MAQLRQPYMLSIPLVSERTAALVLYLAWAAEVE